MKDKNTFGYTGFASMHNLETTKIGKNIKKPQIKDTWDKIWKQYPDTIPEDSPIVLELKKDLTKWIESCAGHKMVLEAGCGTGIISALLAKDRHTKTTLLDISLEALIISKKSLLKYGAEKLLIRGDLFQMPFADGVFDVTWNAGVLEHFQGYDQILALKEMAMVTKPGGYIIVYVPFSKGVFYRIGKWWAEKTGKWEFGIEVPVTSLHKKGVSAGLTLVNEYPICAKEQINFLSQYIMKGTSRVVRYLLGWIPKSLWVRLFGAYLLACIFKKDEKTI
ncbi:MAG: class I SAM-dependent methyltransferase [bacterium]